MEELPRTLIRLMQAMGATYAQTSRELGLTAQQAELLCAAQAGSPVGDLAAFLHCDRSNVTRLVDRAEGRGLVTRRRSDRDGRVTVIELSPDGRRLVERFTKTLGERLRALVEEWPAERREAVVDGIAGVADALEAALESGGPALRQAVGQPAESRGRSL